MSSYRNIVSVALHTIQELEKLPPHHPFHLSSHLPFLQKSSSFYNMFHEIMTKAFLKSCDVKGIQSNENNHSGRAISGPPGVGKTTGMRLCATLVPILLSNVVSVYVDFAMHPNATPFALIQQASQFNTDETPAENLSVLVGDAKRAGFSIMFLGDELSAVYKNNDTWSDLHVLINDYYTSVFLSDSTQQLRAFLEGKDNLQPALNGTKITMLHVEPF